MWIQEPDKERQRPPKEGRDYLMVNNRGRVVEVPPSEARDLIAQGFRRAPKKSEAGDYLPVFDQGEQASTKAVAKNQDTINQPDLLEVVVFT